MIRATAMRLTGRSTQVTTAACTTRTYSQVEEKHLLLPSKARRGQAQQARIRVSHQTARSMAGLIGVVVWSVPESRSTKAQLSIKGLCQVQATEPRAICRKDSPASCFGVNKKEMQRHAAADAGGSQGGRHSLPCSESKRMESIGGKKSPVDA